MHSDSCEAVQCCALACHSLLCLWKPRWECLLSLQEGGIWNTWVTLLFIAAKCKRGNSKQGVSSELCRGLICVSVPFVPSGRSVLPLATTISVHTKRIIPHLGSSTTTSCSGCPCTKSSPWRPWWGRAVCLTCTPTAKVRIKHIPKHLGSGLW